MNARSIFVSRDFLASVAVTLLLALLTPTEIGIQTIRDVVLMKIQVCSIIFSLFFAALSIFTAAGSDEFVKFLNSECDNAYTDLLTSYKFTLTLLGTSLILETISYVLLQVGAQTAHILQTKYWICISTWLFMWAILASIMSAFDSIRLHEYRAAFSATDNHPKT